MKTKIYALNVVEFVVKKVDVIFFISDFKKMETNYLENFLKQGYTSIVASLDFKRLNNGTLVLTPILSIRARNQNRDIIDLLSMKTKCMSLTENGCKFDINNRPSGGKHLIPKENLKCYSDINRIEEIKELLPLLAEVYPEEIELSYTKNKILKKENL